MSYLMGIWTSPPWLARPEPAPARVRGVKTGLKTGEGALFTLDEFSRTRQQAWADGVTVVAKGGCYVQQALELRRMGRARATPDGRRGVLPVTAGGFTQPGRERPHPGGPLAVSPASAGVAHVPAAGVIFRHVLVPFGSPFRRDMHTELRPISSRCSLRYDATFARSTALRVVRSGRCR